MASTSTSLVRSQSAPQHIAGTAPAASSPKKTSIQRSTSHVDVDKDICTKRRMVAQATKPRQGQNPPSVLVPGGDPFNLSGFFPTTLSAIRCEDDEWSRTAGEEEETLPGGGSAIFGEETSETIEREDKLGILALKDVSLFGASVGNFGHGYGRLLSPYAADEVVDENSLYLAQKARRELYTLPGIVGGDGFGEVFLGSHVP